MDCKYVRDGLLEFIGRRLMVSDYRGRCVVTLPIETIDGRFVDVYVEESWDGHVEVHDGGKTASELYAQGMHLTDLKRRNVIEKTAKKMEAHFDTEDDTFKMTVRSSNMNEAILAIAQCASVAMHEVLYHRPSIARMPVPALVRRTLTRWETSDFNISRKFSLKGASSGAVHEFDYVATPVQDTATRVAVQVLSTTHAPKVQARMYGFLILDIRNTEPDNWPRIAVVSNASTWGSFLLRKIEDWSDKVVAVKAGKVETSVRELPEHIEQMAYNASEFTQRRRQTPLHSM